MAVYPYPVAFLSHLTLGVALGVLAAAVLLGYRRGPARVLLACYLVLVGANYFFDGLRHVAFHIFQLEGLSYFSTRAAELANLLDPPFLLLFALAEAGTRLRPWMAALAVAPCLLALLFIESSFRIAPALNAHLSILLPYYAAAFGALVWARLRTPQKGLQRRLDVLLLALAPVVLARIPLAYVDLWIVPGGEGRLTTFSLIIEATLLAVFASLVLAFLAGRRLPGGRSAQRTLLPIGAALGVVAFVWLLRFVPVLSLPTYPFLYSVRWFVFLAVLVREPHSEMLLDARPAAGRLARGTFAALLGATCVAAAAAMDAAFRTPTMTGALFTGMAVAGIVALVVGAFRLLGPEGGGEMASRRLSVYRAQLELGAPPDELEALRRRLGITQREADELASLAFVERSVSAAAPDPGRLFLGRYRVEGVVGMGAFGRVWAATDVADGRPVVLKELREEWRQDPRALRRFVREIRLAMRVRHPNLVGFRGLEAHAGGHVLVLERVEGETLRERMGRARMGHAEAARLARDLASGLAALHRAGIVHCDVKPENVVVRSDGSAVLLDLGAAADPEGPPTLQDGAVGTPAYMAPERARGAAAGPRGDVYALGVVLWEALAGAPPPEGAVPPAWRGFLARALDPDPARRFADAAETERALSEIPPEGVLR